jgi:hypothetical protein
MAAGDILSQGSVILRLHFKRADVGDEVMSSEENEDKTSDVAKSASPKELNRASDEGSGGDRESTANGEPGAKQLLLYETLAPVSSKRHRGWSVKSSGDFSFAKKVNSVPLTAVEFREAAADFPIVFAEAGDGIVPVVLFGLRPGQNLFIDDDGSWTGRYVPAFLRRYPFVFSASSSDEKQIVALCIDESFEGCNQEGRGEHLFDAEGERTQYLTSVVGFQREYQAHAMRTRAFCNKLKELELLEPMSAKGAGAAAGQPVAVTGFQGIERKKLMELSAETLHELSSTGELELAYIHIQSTTNFKQLFRKVASTGAES